jgi:uncharacterized damage-inducible protein DinB
MNIPELFVQRWEAEQPAFGRVLRAVPGDKLDYRPHERSTRAGDLAWQLAIEQRVLSEMLDRGEIRWPADPRPKTIGQIVEAWDKSTEALRQRLRALDESKYAGPSTFVMEGAPPWNDTVGNMLWGFLFDMVHHRGQLSSYLRPMGGKVPAIYGPSADDSGS